MVTAIIMGVCLVFLVAIFTAGYEGQPGEPRK